MFLFSQGFSLLIVFSSIIIIFSSYTSPFSSFPIPTHTLCSYCVSLELLSAEKYTPNVPDVPQEAPSSVHFV